MFTKQLIVALLLSATVGNPAAAAEDPEHQSKNARKVLAVLGTIGINDPEVKSFISGIDKHVKDGYLMLDERHIAGGTLVLHYELKPSATARQLELKFTPDNSNWVATARPNEVMVRYSYKF
jgi:hypothetical protein